MNSDRKKELKNAYKSKPVVGGVCCIRCSGSGREYIQATTDIQGLRNRYDFAVSMGSAPDPTTRGDWSEYGADSFSFTVLEELEKGVDQTDKEFSDDINVLYEYWLEKAQSKELK